MDLPQGRCEMLFVSLLVSWIAGCILTLVVYRMGRWKGRAVAGDVD